LTFRVLFRQFLLFSPVLTRKRGLGGPVTGSGRRRRGDS